MYTPTHIICHIHELRTICLCVQRGSRSRRQGFNLCHKLTIHIMVLLQVKSQTIPLLEKNFPYIRLSLCILFIPLTQNTSDISFVYEQHTCASWSHVARLQACDIPQRGFRGKAIEWGGVQKAYHVGEAWRWNWSQVIAGCLIWRVGMWTTDAT